MYVELEKYGEIYEIEQPPISVHNLIIGSLYIDIGGKSTIRNCNKEGEQCIFKYQTRGWTSSNAFKVDGEIYKGKDIIYKIGGKWNESIGL